MSSFAFFRGSQELVSVTFFQPGREKMEDICIEKRKNSKIINYDIFLLFYLLFIFLVHITGKLTKSPVTAQNIFWQLAVVMIFAEMKRFLSF